MADRVAATGILLVGGASERFGSPKALVSFRGETLAERGWRVLHETCAEVVAVGKEADALELPFPIVDDDAEGRAPVFGVLAGLRAARHERAIVLFRSTVRWSRLPSCASSSAPALCPARDPCLASTPGR